MCGVYSMFPGGLISASDFLLMVFLSDRYMAEQGRIRKKQIRHPNSHRLDRQSEPISTPDFSSNK